MFNDDLEKELIDNKMVVTQISGKSMQPFLNDNDKVVISFSNDYKLLDICLIRIGNQYLLHRLISIENNKYRFKGDNNISTELVNKENILGVLSAYYENDRLVELSEEINKKYYRYSKLKKPLLYLKKILKPKSKYFVVNVAGLNIKIHNIYNFVYDMCKDYLSNSYRNIDLSISYTENEIKSISDVGSIEYKEYILVHEKIARQLHKFDRVLIHGAAISFNGNAFLFTGDSGIGKSTHVNFLKESFNTIKVINGDKPVLDDKGNIYGTPWSGKENWNSNTNCPLKSVIFVNRDDYNHIEKLEKNKCLEKLLDSVYKEENLSKTLDILDKALNDVSFYNLYCTNNPEAAILSFNSIINK